MLSAKCQVLRAFPASLPARTSSYFTRARLLPLSFCLSFFLPFHWTATPFCRAYRSFSKASTSKNTRILWKGAGLAASLAVARLYHSQLREFVTGDVLDKDSSTTHLGTSITSFETENTSQRHSPSLISTRPSGRAQLSYSCLAFVLQPLARLPTISIHTSPTLKHFD